MAESVPRTADFLPLTADFVPRTADFVPRKADNLLRHIHEKAPEQKNRGTVEQWQPVDNFTKAARSPLVSFAERAKSAQHFLVKGEDDLLISPLSARTARLTPLWQGLKDAPLTGANIFSVRFAQEAWQKRSGAAKSRSNFNHALPEDFSRAFKACSSSSPNTQPCLSAKAVNRSITSGVVLMLN